MSDSKFTPEEVQKETDNITRLQQEISEIRTQSIKTRWEQLYNLEKDWGDKAYRYLFLTNSGGAIATLSFLGASKDNIDTKLVISSLILFLIGVILVGITLAKQVHFSSNLFKEYQKGFNEFISEKKSYKEFRSEDEKRSKEDCWDYILPYLCFFCFILGVIFGSFAFLCGTAST